MHFTQAIEISVMYLEEMGSHENVSELSRLCKWTDGARLGNW